MDFKDKWINWALELENGTHIELIGDACYHDKEWISKLPKYTGDRNKENIYAFLKVHFSMFTCTSSDDGIVVDAYTECPCPLVRLGVTRNPNLCSCAKRFHKSLFEDVLGQEVEIRILKTVLRGNETCTAAAVN